MFLTTSSNVLQHAIPLTQQVEYFKEYKGKLAAVAGHTQAASIIKDALYLASFGSSDFVQNYYVNPYLNKIFTPDQYGSYLIGIYKNFIQVNTDILYQSEILLLIFSFNY